MKTKSKRLIMFVLGGGALALLGLWVYSTKEPCAYPQKLDKKLR